MTENQIAKAVVDVAYKLHTELGPGLLETVYEVLMEHELVRRGFTVRRQVPVPIQWNGVKFTEGFKADLIVNDIVIIELKSVEKLMPVHSKQVLTYLKLMKLRLGLLINFGEERIKDGIRRIANGLSDDEQM